MDDNFEWDPKKRASNIQKHGIDFVDAITVFDDPWNMLKDVTKPEYGEVRFLVIGVLQTGVMAAVVCTWRNNRVRLITTRRVRKNEQRDYDRRKATG